MSPAETKKAVGIVRGRGLTIPLEASGGITLENIRKYALAGVDLHFRRRPDAIRGSGRAEHAGDNGYFLARH